MSYITSLLNRKLMLTLLFIGSCFSQIAIAEGDSTVYVKLKPDFVVNYASNSSKLKYIKTTITVRTNTEHEALVNANLPLVRDVIVTFLSSRTQEQVTGAIAREETRKEAKTLVNNILKEETGQDLIKDLLFSSFVTQ